MSKKSDRRVHVNGEVKVNSHFICIIPVIFLSSNVLKYQVQPMTKTVAKMCKLWLDKALKSHFHETFCLFQYVKLLG